MLKLNVKIAKKSNHKKKQELDAKLKLRPKPPAYSENAGDNAEKDNAKSTVQSQQQQKNI